MHEVENLEKDCTICTYIDEMETLEGSPDDDPLRYLIMKDPNKLKVFASVLLHSEKISLSDVKLNR